MGSRVSSCDPSGGHGTSPGIVSCQSPGRRGATEVVRISFKQSYSQIIYLVEEGVEGPRNEEADPANCHHDPHLAWAQGVRDSIDVNQFHFVLHAQLCGDGQPGKKEEIKLSEQIYACRYENQSSLTVFSHFGKQMNITQWSSDILPSGLAKGTQRGIGDILNFTYPRFSMKNIRK